MEVKNEREEKEGWTMTVTAIALQHDVDRVVVSDYSRLLPVEVSVNSYFISLVKLWSGSVNSYFISLVKILVLL